MSTRDHTRKQYTHIYVDTHTHKHTHTHTHTHKPANYLASRLAEWPVY